MRSSCLLVLLLALHSTSCEGFRLKRTKTEKVANQVQQEEVPGSALQSISQAEAVGPSVLLSASKQDRWGDHVTQLLMTKGGRAQLKNIYKNDEKHARFTVGHTLSGTWSRSGPEHFVVTFDSDTEQYLKDVPRTRVRNIVLSPPATLRVAVIDGSKVQLSGLQDIKLHYNSLMLNTVNGKPVALLETEESSEDQVEEADEEDAEQVANQVQQEEVPASALQSIVQAEGKRCKTYCKVDSDCCPGEKCYWVANSDLAIKECDKARRR